MLYVIIYCFLRQTKHYGNILLTTIKNVDYILVMLKYEHTQQLQYSGKTPTLFTPINICKSGFPIRSPKT